MEQYAKRKELEAENERLRAELDKRTHAAGEAINKLWKDIILARKPDYGDWEYPMQAYRHIMAEFNDLKAELAKYKPSWDNAPEWAQWLACDEFYSWYWYSHEPTFSMGDWFMPHIPAGEQWRLEYAGEARNMIGILEARP